MAVIFTIANIYLMLYSIKSAVNITNKSFCLSWKEPPNYIPKLISIRWLRVVIWVVIIIIITYISPASLGVPHTPFVSPREVCCEKLPCYKNKRKVDVPSCNAGGPDHALSSSTWPWIVCGSPHSWFFTQSNSELGLSAALCNFEPFYKLVSSNSPFVSW